MDVESFVNTKLLSSSPWGSPLDASASSRPLLRVVVLDGVYNHARNMFKAMRTRLPPDIFPPFVALHPTTLSVYHRATKKYGASSGVTVTSDISDHDPLALRICTVEAYALLLRELGEPAETIEALVKGVVANNDALKGEKEVRPEGGMPTSTTSGAARRRRRREQEKNQGAEVVKETANN